MGLRGLFRADGARLCRGGVCAWGDVVSMCVDGEVDAPQDLEVSVMHASREAERGVVGTLRVPILSIRQHTFDVAHTDDPDKVRSPFSTRSHGATITACSMFQRVFGPCAAGLSGPLRLTQSR